MTIPEKSQASQSIVNYSIQRSKLTNVIERILAEHEFVQSIIDYFF